MDPSRLCGLILAVALAGCGSTPREYMLDVVEGPIVLPMHVVGDSKGAAWWWNQYSVTPLFALADECPDQIGCVFVLRGSLPYPVRGLSEMTVSPRGEILWCDVTVADDAPEVIRHELGHCLGLRHAESSDDIMYPYARPYGQPDPEAIARVLQGWSPGRD